MLLPVILPVAALCVQRAHGTGRNLGLKALDFTLANKHIFSSVFHTELSGCPIVHFTLLASVACLQVLGVQLYSPTK